MTLSSVPHGCSVATPRHGADVSRVMSSASREEVSREDVSRDEEGRQGVRKTLGARVLIVEDDDEIREAAQDALTELGYDAYAEATAEKALASLHQRVPAAVIADVRMPGMSGIEFCKRLTGDWPEVPVLLMTAFGDVDMAVEALRAGALDFIPKPLSFEHLASVLEQAVTRQTVSPAMVRLEDPAMPD